MSKGACGTETTGTGRPVPWGPGESEEFQGMRQELETGGQIIQNLVGCIQDVGLYPKSKTKSFKQ